MQVEVSGTDNWQQHAAAQSSTIEETRKQCADLRARESGLLAKLEELRVANNRVSTLEKQAKLRNEQLGARLALQDSHVADLEGQLSSLYAAIEMMEADRDRERRQNQEQMASESLARQLQMQEQKSDPPRAIAVPSPEALIVHTYGDHACR